MSSIKEVLQEYSTTPDQVQLPRAYPGECSMLGMELLTAPDNALGLVGTALRTTIEVRKREKGKKPTRRQVPYLLVHRVLNEVSRADEHTPLMLAPLHLVPDCSHSHLVLELNVLAFLLKLPATTQLGCYVHYATTDLSEPARKPELITVERCPDLIKTLLNHAFQQRRRAAAEPSAAGLAALTPKPEAAAVDTVAAREPGPANDSGSSADSDTGGSSLTHLPAPSRAPQVQQVRRHLQQQVLF